MRRSQVFGLSDPTHKNFKGGTMTKAQLPALQEKAITLRDYLHSPHIIESLQKAMPEWLKADRLLKIVFTATMKNPTLLDCTRESLLSSVMQCAQVGLEPVMGRAHLVPYSNRKNVGGQWTVVKECQMQVGYQGFIDLGRRTGAVVDVYAKVVYMGDLFDIEFGTERKLFHKPNIDSDPGKIRGAYTVWELTGGIKSFEFMTITELHKVRAVSQAYKYAIANPDNKKAQQCPWIEWPEEQMKKTVTKRHAKYMPMSIEFMQAVELDTAAELGRSQAGMFSDEPIFGYPEPTEPESPKEPVPYDPSKFFSLCDAKGEYDTKKLEDFMIQSVERMKDRDPAMTTDKLMVIAEDDFERFWTAFQDWAKPAPAQKPAAKPKPAATPPAETPPAETPPITDQRVDCPWPDCSAKFIPKPSPGEARHINRVHDGNYPQEETTESPDMTGKGPGSTIDQTETVDPGASGGPETEDQTQMSKLILKINSFSSDVRDRAYANLEMIPKKVLSLERTATLDTILAACNSAQREIMNEEEPPF
jgi:recombination protein RecT